jgi:uncharacterized cysteine cluster protein YcgN (CxxCxxCC family)
MKHNLYRPRQKDTLPFWQNQSLEEMTAAQWESLCDGCGICCLEKLEDAETGVVEYTAVACRHLDTASCRCRIYDQRHELNADCIRMTAQTLKTLPWLPDTCAYRRLAEGRNMPSWHPLVTGNPESVHRQGVGIRDRVLSALYVHPDDLEAYRIQFWIKR